MKYIDKFLDATTMYRLVLYYLILLVVAAFVFSFFKLLPFGPIQLAISTIAAIVLCYVTNKIFSWVFGAPTNSESLFISALLIVLIVSPPLSFADAPLLFWVCVLTMSSKYIMAIKKKHIFNPVAIAVVLTSQGFGGSASWWIATLPMLPFALLGFLIVKKIRRYDMILYFFLSALISITGLTLFNKGDLINTYKEIFLSYPIIFFAFVMLTEPLTTPPTKKLQAIYGAIVGFLFSPEFHIYSLYTTPEVALVVGNVFSYIVSPKYKLVLKLKEKIKTGTDMVDFLFKLEDKLDFTPGQYMEWTLPHVNPDKRGNRRYFTVASSPTENTLRLGVKFYPKGSSFKKNLILVDDDTPVIAGSMSGDFTLPKDPTKKLVFIAGGIGVTPFRSMIKYLVDKGDVREITLIFSNRTQDEIIYSDLFTQAQHSLGIKTVYTLTDKDSVPANWTGKVGRVDEEMIKTEVPDYLERYFYISGPHVMVVAFEKTLRKMGIKRSHIIKDFFPGFA